MGTHLQYEFTQCYLPPGRGDIPSKYVAATVARLDMKNAAAAAAGMGLRVITTAHVSSISRVAIVNRV